MTTPEVQKYALMLPFSDNFKRDGIEFARQAALDSWRRGVKRDGFREVETPTAEIRINHYPWQIDPDTGEEIKLPDRAWAISGRVMPVDSTPV